jgi:hypothetical protein
MTAPIARPQRTAHAQVCALLAEQIIGETLVERGWGLVQSPLAGRRRLLTLVTDGSVVGACTAHDPVSRQLLDRAPWRVDAGEEHCHAFGTIRFSRGARHA